MFIRSRFWVLLRTVAVILRRIAEGMLWIASFGANWWLLCAITVLLR